jgi:hypothetical protein
MSISSMSVSVDGFSTGRQGTFDWTYERCPRGEASH